jgi:hypothetical protein
MSLRDERRRARAFLHELRVSRDEESENVTELHRPISRCMNLVGYGALFSRIASLPDVNP